MNDVHSPIISTTSSSPRGQLAKAERDAHAFALKTGQPTPVMLARLQRAFEVMLEKAADDAPKRLVWIEGALALRLVLISGRDLKEIHSLHILPAVSQFDPSWPTPRLLQIAGYQPALWLQASPPSQSTANVQEPEYAPPASHAVWFGLDDLSERWLRLVRSRPQLTVETKATFEGKRLFSAPTVQGLEAAVDAFREEATGKMGGAGTDYLPKVKECAQFLRRQLAVCSPGDPATSWLMTNTSPPRNAATASYTSLSLPDAQRYQADAVAATKGGKSDEGKRKSDADVPALPTVLNERVIGSRFCPSRAVVSELRDRLLIDARRGRGRMSEARLSEFDHAFTAYSWLFFSLHTGWRPPPDKILPDACQLDWATGAFFLEDKLARSTKVAGTDENAEQPEILDDVEEGDAIVLQANASDKTPIPTDLKKRWVPLGKRVLAQLRAYHDHVERRSERCLSKPPILRRDDMLAHVRGVSDVTKQLRWNFNRHYLRSNLIGKVSVEAINTYLGHWDTGSEPWANGSCLDPVAYVHEIQSALDKLFPAEEWPVIQGFR